MKTTTTFLIFLGCLLLQLPAWAQQTVEGTVQSALDQEPVPGVSVRIKGTTRGGATNLDGSYRLEVPGPDAVLVYSFIGMKTKEVLVGNQSRIDVSLEDELSQLEEVVVVGYGETSRRLLTGSVAQVSSEDIENTVSPSLDGAMQGRIAGVQVNQNSGTPGGGISVQIRGSSSIQGGNQPLYVIDGVPMTTGDYSQISFEGQGINALADLNPDDIESISVLKDASSAAIYGARAGNGVVLITTKSGTGKKTQVNLDAYSGVQQVYKRLDMLNAGQFMEYLNDVSLAQGGQPVYTQEMIDNPPVNTDWLDEVLRTAPITNVDLSVSGGSGQTTYFVSGSFFDQEGVIIGSGFQRYNGRINLNHEINEKVRFGIRTGNSYSINDRVLGDQTINGVLPNAISKPPIFAVTDPETGNYLEEGFWDNPVAIGNESINQATTFRNISNVYGEWDIIPSLTFKNQWGIDYFSLSEIRYEPTTTDRGRENNGLGISGKTNVLRITQLSTLNFSKEIEQHNFGALAGWSFEREKDERSFMRGNDFPSNELIYLGSAGVIEPEGTGAVRYDLGINSYFGRINYSFAEKYLLTLNARWDGSTNFSKENQYGFFPGASLGWRIIEEPFLQPLENTFSDLKLRLGYGLSGNDAIGSFRYLNLYSGGYNYRGRSGIIPTQIPNPDLRWEKTSNFNAGIDLGLWNNRLSLLTDVYYYKTTDLLISRPIPGSAGFSAVAENIGALENRGLEVALQASLIQHSEYSWSTDLNISFNRNKVLSLYNGQPILNQGRGNNAAIEGEPLGVFYMFNSLGVDPSTGDIVFEDANFDGLITDADRQVVGNPNPDFSGGFTNTFTYGNFDLSIFLQFVYGNEIYNGVRQYTENMSFGDSDNQQVSILQRWRTPGDVVPLPRINGVNNNQISSQYIEDGSFLRVKNVSLGYNLPAQVRNKINARLLRVYVRAQNLLTFTDYSGMDPDVNYAGASALRMGTDFFTYPQPRMITGGIKIGF